MNEDQLLEDLGEYLKSKGWNPLVIGFNGVKQGNLKNNFELIVGFTGTKCDVLYTTDETEAKK